MNIVFVNYGLFNSNSGGHVAHFGNALASLGVDVTVIGTGNVSSLNDFGQVAFDILQMPLEREAIPTQLLRIARRPDTLLHAWTPRSNVRQLVERVSAETTCPYVVHLEDHEHLLLASALGIELTQLMSMSDVELDVVVPLSLTHPRRAQEFIKRSIGVTLIVKRLDELNPDQVPIHLLEPGVDTDIFCCDLTAEQIKSLREQLYIDEDAKILVYNGNSHSANYKEIFSLYTAVLILRRRGHNVFLIRTGKDHFDKFDISFQALKGDWVIDLGVLDRNRMIEVLKLADFYVQPGPSEGFNAYRLPSKVPEFLALGRPLIVPATNIGLRLRDGQEALLMRRGDAEEIADKVESLLAMGDQGRHIGRAGRDFAVKHMNWDRNAALLLEFYQQRLGSKNRDFR